MSHMWVGLTNLSQEDYERMLAERRARMISQDDAPGPGSW